ncbi:MAG: 30S ribosome-binding factor RbfA [Holosporales bacterium]|nr:30S ribosome-binding factor RbfA [Holosporales bacterium]
MKLFVPAKKRAIGKRPDRIATHIRECVSMALRRDEFPALPGRLGPGNYSSQITITYAKLSPDLRHATIYFSVLDDATRIESLDFLKAQEPYFKKLIANRMKLRFIPSLSFEIDDTLDKSRKIDELLKGDV